MEDDSFQVSVSPRVLTLWDSLGLDDSQREESVAQLENAIKAVICDFSEQLENKCTEVRNEILSTREKHKKALLAFGVTPSDVEESFPALQQNNLLRQLESAKHAYENFRQIFQARAQKLENLVSMAKELFDNLGVPMDQRGEFGELGENDFNRERIDRFKQKIEELKEISESKRVEMMKIKSKIQTLAGELGEEFKGERLDLMEGQMLSPTAFESANNLLQDLEMLKQRRIDSLSQLAMEITHLWDLLGVSESQRKAFLDEHKTLSDEVIKSCQNEAEKLRKRRDEMLPSLIESQREEVTALWDKLHITEESRRRFVDSSASQEEIVEEFVFLESEVLRLKKLYVEVSHIITAIEQREEIIKEYNEISNATPNPDRLMSRGRGCAQQLMREEKASRRFKVSLPRYEKKLLSMLLEYREKNGIDFEWEGSPYVDQLSHVEPEKKIAKKAHGTKKINSARLNAKTTKDRINENYSPNGEELAPVHETRAHSYKLL